MRLCRILFSLLRVRRSSRENLISLSHPLFPDSYAHAFALSEKGNWQMTGASQYSICYYGNIEILQIWGRMTKQDKIPVWYLTMKILKRSFVKG